MCPSWCTAGELFPYRSSNHPPASSYPQNSHFLCSAGVGRTGTFIALDITLDQMKAEKTVDIKGTMEKMRERRMNMIQTAVSATQSILPVLS